MKAAPSARSWMAAGVRHELLMRALPAVRHDLAAPLSLMRMQLLLLRRHAQADAPAPAEALAARVTQLESQTSEISDSLRTLRQWEWPTPEGALGATEPTRAELVAQAVSLMRAAFELNGIALQVADALNPLSGAAADAGPAERWPDPVGLRYLLLGALCHLHDWHDGLEGGGSIELSPLEDWGVQLKARSAAAAQGQPAGALAPHRAPRHLAIDAVSLQALADDLGHEVQITPGMLVVDLRAP